MRRSFSVEDLLDEVEKICYNASGTSKVRNTFTPLSPDVPFHYVHTLYFEIVDSFMCFL